MQRTARIVLNWVLFSAAVIHSEAIDSPAQSVDVQRHAPPNRHLAVESIPTPPQQAAAWHAPKTKLPKEWVSAAETLFRQGLADPRGCSYCAIELDAGSCLSSAGGVVSTHGWLIPADDAKGQRFAICWNGVVYPIVASGQPADLRADVLDAIKLNPAEKEAWSQGRGGSMSSGLDEDSLEISKVSHQWPSRLWACLLLRLGQVELAEKTWAACAADAPATRDPQDGPEDPYLDLAEYWTGSMFRLAVCAHLRGNDCLALLTAKTLAPIWDAVEVEAAKRRFPEPDRERGQHHKPFYLEGISFIRTLLIDQQRRAAERQAGRSPPVMRAPDDDLDATLAALRKALAQCPDEAHRIALLVQQLEEYSAPERTWCCDPDPEPVIRLLIEAGEPAVEPLLACLENDTRLTRSAHHHYSWDNFNCRGPIGVSEAAYTALAGILDTDFFDKAITNIDLTSRRKPEWAALARRIRSYFNKYKGLSREERWYRILLDDRSPMRWWVEVAQKIVEPADAAEMRGNTEYIAGWLPHPIRKPGEIVKLQGESLRSKTNPTVSEILTQRLRELPLRDSCAIGEALACWDPKAAVPVLRELTKEARASIDAGPWRRDNDNGSATQLFIRLIMARAEHDPQALEEYGQWVRTVTRYQAEECWDVCFTPLLRYRNHSATRAAAEWLFNDASSPWSTIIEREKAANPGFHAKPLKGLLLTLPAFRKQVARLLTVKRRGGCVTTIDKQQVEVRTDETWSGPGGKQPAEAPFSPPGTTVEFRVCDLVAYELSEIRGLPRCELYWPETNRDKAVAACLQFLRKYGERFQADGIRSVEVKLPLLDRPATPEDVQAGRAIFTLAGQGETRVVPLPQRPAPARWLTLKDYPVSQVFFDAKTKQQKTVAGYDQDGPVWQVEEVRSGDTWRRYVGFVGRHCLARVPAEEIEFPFTYNWEAHLDGFEVRTFFPSGDGPMATSRPWIGGPLPIAVDVCNCRGVDRRPPRFVIDEAGATRPKDSIGVTIGLCYADRQSGESFDNQNARLFNWGTEPGPWRELPRKAAPLRLRAADRALKPLETFELVRFDLRDHFELAGPGWYRLVVKLAPNQKPLDHQPLADDRFLIERKPKESPK